MESQELRNNPENFHSCNREKNIKKMSCFRLAFMFSIFLRVRK